MKKKIVAFIMLKYLFCFIDFNLFTYKIRKERLCCEYCVYFIHVYAPPMLCITYFVARVKESLYLYVFINYYFEAINYSSSTLDLSEMIFKDLKAYKCNIIRKMKCCLSL